MSCHAWCRLQTCRGNSSFYEAVSLAALEALSCGVPVVASDVGGLPYVINSNNGILVPPGNPAALADALSQLLANETSRLEKGHNGRQMVLENLPGTKSPRTLPPSIQNSSKVAQNRPLPHRLHRQTLRNRVECRHWV